MPNGYALGTTSHLTSLNIGRRHSEASGIYPNKIDVLQRLLPVKTQATQAAAGITKYA